LPRIFLDFFGDFFFSFGFLVFKTAEKAGFVLTQALRKKMPVVDVAAQGQVVGGALKHVLSNVVSGVERVEVLGYSIRRSEPNVNEGNNLLDFKYGSTALSGLRVTRAGHGYDPDNPPRMDSTATSPSLGVEVYAATATGRHNVAVPDYAEVSDTVTFVRASGAKSPQLGARADCIVADPYRYAYRFYVTTPAYAQQKASSALPLLADEMTAVHFEIAPGIFGAGSGGSGSGPVAAARERLVSTITGACLRAVAPAGLPAAAAPPLRLEYTSAGFQFVSTTNAPFVLVDGDRLAYILSGRSPRRHANSPYERRTMQTGLKVAGPGVVVAAYVRQSEMLDNGIQSCRYDGDGPHDLRVATIRDEVSSARAVEVEALTGTVLTARLRPGNYPIGSVLHAPYPVVLNVDERASVADADAPAWRDAQRELGAYATKAYGLSRRQAADGLIKEVQDAMNLAVHAGEYAGLARVDPHSLPDLFSHVTHEQSERRVPGPHVYDPNVPFVDNPAFLCADTEASALGYQYEPGRQSKDPQRRRKQSIFVTLEDPGGDVHTADDEPFSHEGLGWNGYRATRVRITTRENRVGDVRADGSTIRADSETDTKTGLDRGARKADPALQGITLLFGTGPNRERSIHRALGFMDADYTAPTTFVVRRPVLSHARPETAEEEADEVADAEDATDGLHVILRPDEAGAVAGLLGGHEYWRESDSAAAAVPSKYQVNGRVTYARYVPVDAVVEASTTVAGDARDADFRYRGGRRHFAYYEVLGYQAPHAYCLDTDPLIVAVAVDINERRHADAERVQTPTTRAGFALLPIGCTDHVEPRTMHDGSAYQQAMLNYKLSGYVTAPHAVGVDRALSGFRNFGRVAPNAQDPSGRRWAATAQEASSAAGRDSVFGSRQVHMLKAGDFGSKMLVLDEPVTAQSLTFRFSRIDSTVPYEFGAQEITLLVRLHVTTDRTNFRR
jgi:hypothetical protein